MGAYIARTVIHWIGNEQEAKAGLVAFDFDSCSD